MPISRFCELFTIPICHLWGIPHIDEKSFGKIATRCYQTQETTMDYLEDHRMNRRSLKTVTMRMLSASAIAGLRSFSIPAAADITRGCKARWEVRFGATTVTFADFDVRGRCRSKAYANDCRRAARAYAQECFRSHWNYRWNDDVRRGVLKPPSCLRRGDIGVMSYPLRDVKRAVEFHTCQTTNQRPITVLIVGRTYDGERCGGEVLLSSTYGVTEEMCNGF